MWSGEQLGASIVLQFAGTDLEILPAGTKVSVLDTNGTVLATNTAKTGISINRPVPAVKYGATTTFIYNNPIYDGASWKTTTGSLTNLDQIKQVKIEYTIDDIKYEKIVNAEVYVGE